MNDGFPDGIETLMVVQAYWSLSACIASMFVNGVLPLAGGKACPVNAFVNGKVLIDNGSKDDFLCFAHPRVFHRCSHFLWLPVWALF